MFNFDATSKKYREHIRWDADALMDRMVTDHLLKGGTFDADKITRMFHNAVKTTQLILDLFIGAGLDPLEENKDDDQNSAAATTGQSESGLPANAFVTDDEQPGQTLAQNDLSNLGERDSEGPTGSVRTPSGVSHPERERDSSDDNGPTGGRKVNAAEQQPVPPVTGPRAGRRHSGGPSSS